MNLDTLPDINPICKQLIEINKKYENCSFVDIDFIDLFAIKNNNIKNVSEIDQLKKKITSKYYSISLKYHPDKYINETESIIKIKNCFVKIDDIKTGLFQGFIKDIYEMLIKMIKETPEMLIDIINGKTDTLFNQFDLNNDFKHLKDRYCGYIENDNKQLTKEEKLNIEQKLQTEQVKDIKIDETETKNLINIEVDKRKHINIEKIFTEQQRDDPNFSNIFNEKFKSTKNNSTNTQSNNQPTIDIMPFNTESTNNDIMLSSNATHINTSSCITNIDEAFEPLNINENINKQITYEELIKERENQAKTFKTTKQKIELNECPNHIKEITHKKK